MTSDTVIGVEDVIELFKDVEKLSLRSVTKAAKAGSQIALKDARQNCPESVDGSHGQPPGTLKSSLGVKLEKTKKQAKRVYQVGPGQEGWYAHFVDYGFTDKSGTVWEGNKFLRNSVDNNREAIERDILQVLVNELKKLR